MNTESIFNLFDPKGKAHILAQQGISTLILGSVVFSLVALTAYTPIVHASGPELGRQLSLEILRALDPADRKFFTPGYGTQVVRSEQVAVLPTVDPADRKFFSQGYIWFSLK